MQKITKYLLSLGLSFGLIIIFSFFINLFNYFELLSGNIYKIILILLISLSIFVGGFYLGKNQVKNGFLNGLIYGLIICIIFMFISFIIVNEQFTISSLIYYLIIIITSISSAVIGINITSKEK